MKNFLLYALKQVGAGLIIAVVAAFTIYHILPDGLQVGGGGFGTAIGLPLNISRVATSTTASTAVTLSTTDTRVVASSTHNTRQGLIIANDSGHPVYCSINNDRPAVSGKGIRLNPNSASTTSDRIVFDSTFLYLGSVHCIASSTVQLLITEK